MRESVQRACEKRDRSETNVSSTPCNQYILEIKVRTIHNRWTHWRTLSAVLSSDMGEYVVVTADGKRTCI